ncbi:MAG: hypothetical protein NTX36_15960 [Proteobacteria bacterium]|nr:hypothetical protein [Pseudomonadota bacterium]
MPKTNYYFIDEAGDLNDQSKTFLFGCIITDTPEDLLNDIECLESEIINSGYYYRFRDDFLKTGFHASKNHLDIYGRFVALLATMNFRAYAVILNKRTEYFKKIVSSQSKNQIYDSLIKILLKDRLKKRAEDTNQLFFEQNLSGPTPHRIELRERELSDIIEVINNELSESNLTRARLAFQVSLQNKKEQKIFAVVDYINHIITKVYEGRNNNVQKFMKENFRLIEPKIGCIHDVVKKTFHMPRKKVLEIDNEFVG